MRIKYVGKKPTKQDNVAGTGKVWVGAGDVHEIPDEDAALLLKHPDVWAEAAAAEPEPLPPAETEPRWVLEPLSDEAAPVVLDTMTDAEIRKFGRDIGLTVANTLKGDELREYVYGQVQQASEGGEGPDESTNQS